VTCLRSKLARQKPALDLWARALLRARRGVQEHPGSQDRADSSGQRRVSSGGQTCAHLSTQTFAALAQYQLGELDFSKLTFPQPSPFSML